MNEGFDDLKECSTGKTKILCLSIWKLKFNFVVIGSVGNRLVLPEKYTNAVRAENVSSLYGLLIKHCPSHGNKRWCFT